MLRNLSALLAIVTSSMATAATPPIDALLHYEGQEITRAGVTKRISYDEKLIRRDGHVWSQRLLPKAVENLPPEPKGAVIHEEFDIDGTSRHVSRDGNGKVKVEFVTRARDLVVAVSPAEYESVAFVTSFDAAGALIEPAEVAKMKKISLRSPVAGAEWHERVEGNHYTRVLWSPGHEVALVLESGNLAGTTSARTTLKLLPRTPDSQLPWQGIASLPHKEYSDFMD